MAKKQVKVRLLFVDDGEYHDEEFSVPGDAVDTYDRLIDFIREDPLVLKRLHVDLDRLCAAQRVDG